MQKNINKSPLGAFRLTAIILYALAASAFLPVAIYGDPAVTGSYLFGAASVAMCVVGLMLTSALAGGFKPILPFGIITAFIFMILGIPRLAATLPILFILVSLVSYICLVSKAFVLIPIGIAAYASAFFILGDVFLAAFSLIALPAGYVLYRAHNAGADRVGAILRISVCIGVFALALTLAQLYFAHLHVAGGELTLETLRTYFESLREDLTGEIATALHATYNQVLADSLSMADAIEIATLSVSTVFNFFPAICIIFLIVLSYIIHSLYIALNVPLTEDIAVIKRAICFKMSLTSAVIFILALIASACLDYDKQYVWAVAAKNVYAILIPGLTLLFLSFIGAFTKGERASCLGIIIYIALIGMLVYLPSVMLPLSALGGALLVIITEIRIKIEQKHNNDNH